MNNFNCKFNHEFQKRIKSNPATVNEVMQVFKDCCRELDVDECDEVKECSFFIELYDEVFTLNFYYIIIKLPDGREIDESDSFMCEFTLPEKEKIDNEVCDEWGSGDISDVFLKIEKSNLFQHFKDKSLPFKTYYHETIMGYS
ncbi:MAG: hypothetical protein NE327_05230 [Lentisphaeraceae bacterium]|nr:hypothetical protein [Lentisphaeraceae bacterium]